MKPSERLTQWGGRKKKQNKNKKNLTLRIEKYSIFEKKKKSDLLELFAKAAASHHKNQYDVYRPITQFMQFTTLKITLKRHYQGTETHLYIITQEKPWIL